ncbi:MAG: NYN domain-containing protein, partial [Gemmatimonadaceae bacterium]
TPRRPVAPIHRGPQAVSQQNLGSHTVHHAPNAALLIDFDNVTMGIRSDLQMELKNLLSSDIIKGKVSVQRAYADWRRYPQYIVPLAESSIDMIMAPAYGSAKKNATDIRLAIDALELVFVRPEIGTFILLSGDSDFSSLVIKLKEYGKYVIGVGIRESSSDLLVMNCDEYYSYNSLAGLVKNNEEEVIKRDPWELVSEAVQRMKRNGDVMRADRLKQVMQQIDSSFDEKNVGKSKFSLFVSEAARKGLVSLTKLENGQLEVDLPRGGAVEAPAEVSDVEAVVAPLSANVFEALDDASRSRRGGRGGRGRSRDRGERTPAEARPRDGSVAVSATAPPAAASEEAEFTSAAAVTEAPVSVAVPAPRPARPQHPSRMPKSEPAEIGVTGIRLTRDEAFDLVRRAVASVTGGDAAIASSRVRSAARSLLGHDSESLSERNFIRILHDAHDADLVDLRRRGSDYEVAVSVAAPPVDVQLEAAATANAPAVKAIAPAPRGMGARGLGRGPMGGKGVPPAHLLSMGAVGGSRIAAAIPPEPAVMTQPVSSQAELDIAAPSIATRAAASATEQEAMATSAEAASAKSGRKRPAAAKKATAKSPAKSRKPAAAAKSAARSGEPSKASVDASTVARVRKSPTRPARKKTAPRSAAKEPSES